MYNEFINHYKQVHINPWHEISEDQLNQLFNNLVNSININNDYSFNYLMNYILKRLNGISDAHTRYDDEEKLPINFIIFDNQVIINYPDKLKGSTLLEINGVPINQIIEELDEVITYGTPGRKKYEI